MNLIKDQGLPDFIMLEDHEVNEEGFMNNLRLRFEKKQIYTYIGEQLVAMNPFQKMDDLYTKQTLEKYKMKYLFEVQPHIYALAEDTFRALIKNKIDQCVIVTGESGAGKTEASKIFMQYISAVSAGGKGAEHIKEKLLESNPVLEAFGNAKTLRNDNSSRFGKYMEIQFDEIGRPLGGKISQYLLEKSRVVVRALDERAFHIFYQFLSDKSLNQQLKLSGKPEDYNYLALSKCYKVDNMDDLAEFKLVLKAMKTLGFKDEDMNTTWHILAAVLTLGNGDFIELKTSNNVDASQIKDVEPFHRAAELLKVDAEVLKKVLTSRLVTSGVNRRTSSYNVPLSVDLARFTRDSLAKALYDKVFSWVTETVNVSILAREKVSVMIGVLDIYGFEIFENNSFEQFCINYCNEKLQQLFIKLVLKMEQEEYVREGIEWTEIDYFDNGPIVELIEGGTGIFKLLDEASVVGDKTPKSFLQKLDQNLMAHKHYESYAKEQKSKDSKGNRKGLGDKAFRILHYAGEVDYHVEHFINKNNDTLFNDLILCLQGSSDPMIRGLYPREMDEHEKARTRKQRTSPVSAGIQFTRNVGALIEKLQSCQPHYIRTIKSNDVKRGFTLNDERVRHQCRYLNLVETVRVRKAGFCHRQAYEGWFHRYHMISSKTWPTWKNNNYKEGVKQILDDIGCTPDEYRLGHTKLFVRGAKSLFKFEELRAQHMPKVAVAIQRRYKGHRQRCRTKRIKAALKIQCWFRRLRAKKAVKRLRATVRIQRFFRKRRAVRQTKRAKAARKIGKVWRGAIARRYVRRLKAARTIQTRWRGFREKLAYRKENGAALIRAHILGWMVRKNMTQYKKREKRRRAALKLQKVWRGVFYRKWVKGNKDRLAAERAARIQLRKAKIALYLQNLIRQHAAAKEVARRAAVRTVQRTIRGFIGRRRAKKQKSARKMQKVFRGHRARVFVKKLRATISLQGMIRRHWLRRYVKRVTQSRGAAVKKEKKNNFGKTLEWPPFAPAPLASAEKVMKKMWHLYWAHIKIKSLDKNGNVAMRQKVRTLNIFMGNKPWNPARPFTADYVGLPSNPAKQVYLDAMQHLFQAGGDTQINFSDDLIKVNRKHAAQHQVIIVTDANVYKYKPKAFKIIKVGTPLRSCQGIVMSKGTPDTFVIIKFAPPFRDMVLDAGASGEERMSELVTVVTDRVLALTGKVCPVSFSSSIVYNNMRTDKAEGTTVTLSFGKNPNPPKVPGMCEFKGSGPTANVYFP